MFIACPDHSGDLALFLASYSLVFSIVSLVGLKFSDRPVAIWPGALAMVLGLPHFIGALDESISSLLISSVSLTLGIISIVLGTRIRKRIRPWPYPCCTKCTYNLTGNVSGNYPECGTRVPSNSERV